MIRVAHYTESLLGNRKEFPDREYIVIIVSSRKNANDFLRPGFIINKVVELPLDPGELKWLPIEKVLFKEG